MSEDSEYYFDADDLTKYDVLENKISNENLTEHDIVDIKTSGEEDVSDDAFDAKNECDKAILNFEKKVTSVDVVEMNLEPSVYVDKAVLDKIDSNVTDQIECAGATVQYEINNDMFWDIDCSIKNMKLVEFEIHAQKVVNDNLFTTGNSCDTYCSTPGTDSADEDNDLGFEELPITYQKAAQGIIINCNVYLTDHQWNTLIFIDITTIQCAVCDMYSDIDTCSDHIDSTNHKKNLDLYKPLKKFDLSITRKIKNKLHCAVCNELFNLENETDHYVSKSHEGNSLFAINKVSDIMYDYDINNDSKKDNDCYHFNAKAISNNNIKYDSADETESNDNYDEYYVYKDHDDLKVNENDEYECYVNENDIQMNTGTSYATMAKKPKAINVPKFLVKDVGNRKVRIKYDSWHMIVHTKVNEFYCMVCKEKGHIRFKVQHSQDREHTEKLSSCNIVEIFEDYFIRQVDDKLYHCGHCNNLQLIHEMEDHIESTHPRRIRKISECSSAQTSVKNDNFKDKNIISPIYNDNENIPDEKTTPNVKDTENPSKDNNNNSSPKNNTYSPISTAATLNNEIPTVSIFDEIVLYPFGYKLKLPILNYNVVCKRVNDFYCGLCDLICEENLIFNHIYNQVHIELLQRTPFIMVFNCNLIRSIREKLHCTICNMPIHPEHIYNHNMDPSHVKLLRIALEIESKPMIATSGVGIIPEARSPSNVARVAPNSIETIPDQNKTLPRIVETPAKIPPTDTKLTSNLEDVDKTTKNLVRDIDFVEVPKTICKDIDNEQINKETDLANDSFESESDIFDTEEYVYIKLNNKYIKITNSSFNTFVCVGDGSRYCFVCSIHVEFNEISKHLQSRGHTENLEKYKFIDKYEEHLLRQFYLLYHCGICNVLVSRKQLKDHIEWPTHALQIESTVKNAKKQRKNEIKTGMKEIIVLTQKEDIYLNGKETKIDIVFDVGVINENDTTVIEKKNKIIICSDVVLKVKWDHWHGICETKNGFKCRICQKDINKKELDTHVNSQWHSTALGIPFEAQYSTALIRKVNDTTFNCVICNTEMSNNDFIVNEHVGGKKHTKNYENILQETSVTNSYSDCSDDVMII